MMAAILAMSAVSARLVTRIGALPLLIAGSATAAGVAAGILLLALAVAVSVIRARRDGSAAARAPAT